MKKISLVLALVVFSALLAACTQTEAPVAEPAAPLTADAVLTVGSVSYSQPELETFTIAEVDFTNRDGETTTYSGVPLITLLEEANLTAAGETLVFTAADDYEAELSLADALACDKCIVAFDDGSLRMVMPEMPGNLQVKDVVEISVK